MCGLVGMAGNIVQSDEAVMQRLLVLDYPRGKDSTGLASVGHNNEIKIVKETLNPLSFFELKQFEDVNNAWEAYALIGHNRAATLGKVNAVNAHPFQYGDVVGAHNGTLDKASWDRLEAAAGIQTDVDSAAIFAAIDKLSTEEVIPLMETGAQSARGAWALTYFDGSHDTMNWIRNPHRPLWFALSKQLDKIYWASEWEMINAAVDLTKNSTPLFVCDDGYSFWPFQVNRHYSISPWKLARGFNSFTEFKEEFEGEIIEGRKPVLPEEHKGYAKNSKVPWKKKKEKKTGNVTTLGGTTGSTSNGPEIVSVTTSAEEFAGPEPFKTRLSKIRFQYITKKGCSFCGTPIDITDDSYSIYERDGKCLCGSCNGNKGKRIYNTGIVLN